jgi:hypothetical protein
LVKADGGEHGLVEAISEDEVRVEGFAGDGEEDFGCTVVDVEGVEVAYVNL